MSPASCRARSDDRFAERSSRCASTAATASVEAATEHDVERNWSSVNLPQFLLAVDVDVIS